MIAQILQMNGPLVTVRYGRFTSVWSLTSGGMRKEHNCAICHEVIAVGSRAYRPISNQGDRGQRICASCVEAAAGEE